MSKNNHIEVLTLLLFFILPGLGEVLDVFDSYAGGISIILALILAKHITSFKITISRSNLNVVILCLFLFFLQYINHYFYVKSDILKSLAVSISLPIIYYICEKFYFQICSRENIVKIVKITSYIIIFCLFLAALYYARSDASGAIESSKYRLLFITEPSHVSVICGPLLVCFVFLGKNNSSKYIRLMIVSVLIFILGSVTGIIILILILFTMFKIHKFVLQLLFLFFLILLISSLNIQSFNYIIDLFSVRASSFIASFNREDFIGLNLSIIIFIQGYEFIWDTIVRLDFLGIGSGNGKFHTIDYRAFNANNWLHGDKRLNVSDPGFMLSKVFLEYGLLFGGLYLIIIYKLSKYFFLVRNRILNFGFDYLDIIYVGCFLTTLVNCFFRGGGYIHHSMFYFFLSIIIYRNDRKKK